MTGNSVSPNFPNLAGQIEAYTVAQLTRFKTHSRQDPAGFEYMWGISRSLTEEQIKGLASYYARQAPVAVAADALPGQIAAGRDLFAHGLPSKNVPPCASCHGPEARGSAGFPRLAGQHADYLNKQLGVFQRGDERPDGAVMKNIAHALSQTDIDEVALFLQSL